MNARHLMGSLVAACALTAAGPVFAGTDYESPADGFVSSRARADVLNELQGASTESSLGVSSRIDANENIGAYGKAGSSYSAPARDEDRSKLRDQGQSHSPNTPNMPGDLYFGD